ncbi:MAG: exodeoxyribonuclease V subunit gamma [Actinobacteria bacterium]|nr:exodeoxyribonuclease V subunit gamma [Actinomycetota bacterium]
MRSTVASDRLESLVPPLVELLRDVPEDPMAAEWVAVPSPVIQRWLALELARELGTTGDRDDGVSANIEFVRPAALWQAVFAGAADTEGIEPTGGSSPMRGRSLDPWDANVVAWRILAVAAADRPLATAAGAPDARPTIVWAQHTAGLLAGYELGRPEMIRAWANGSDVDAAGRRLADDQRWQPRLWRSVRELIGHPSPAERLPGILAALTAGGLDLALPPRLFIFGLETIPGGNNFISLLDALAVDRDIHVFAPSPSPTLFDVPNGPSPDDPDAGLHRLVASWGATARDAARLLGAGSGEVEFLRGVSPATTGPSSTLGDLHSAIVDGTVAGRAEGTSGVDALRRKPDVWFHECTGAMRQAEVLRDTVVHLLATDPTLTEEDILVVCPALDRFSSLIRASFTVDTSGSTTGITTDRADAAVRVALGFGGGSARNAVVDVLEALTALAGGPARSNEVFEFCTLDGVARRYGFDDDALDQLRTWIVDKGVRWGFDVAHREGFGVPSAHRANTWEFAVDSLLAGIAVAGGPAPAIGGIVADDGSASVASIVGRFAEVIAGLRDAAATIDEPTDPQRCVAIIRSWIDRFVALDDDDTRSLEAVLLTLHEIADHASRGSDTSTVVTPGDVARLAVERHQLGPSTSHVLRGGIDVVPLRPACTTPHRVIVLIGIDEGALAGDRIDGDNLAMVAPRPGDPDPRAAMRQALLDTVLAARERLIVIRDGTDIATGKPVAPPVVVAELLEAILDGVDADQRRDATDRIVLRHPRHAGDPDCFVPGGSGPLEGWTRLLADPRLVERPWGVDPAAFAGARKRVSGDIVTGTPINWVLDRPRADRTVSLADLQRFFRNPTKAFATETVGIRLEAAEADLDETLPVDVDALARWGFARDLLAAELVDTTRPEPPDLDAIIDDAHRLLVPTGLLPVGRFADAVIDEVAQQVHGILDAYRSIPRAGDTPTRVETSIELADGTSVVADVEAFAPGGDARSLTVIDATPSRVKPQDRLEAWLTLLVLNAHDPTIGWTVHVIRRADDDTAATSPVTVRRFRLDSLDHDDRRSRAFAGLAVAVGMWRFGSVEPLPYFATVSPAIARDPTATIPTKLWHAFGDAQGDGEEPYTSLVYGDATLESILDEPCSDRDVAWFTSQFSDPTVAPYVPDADSLAPGRVAAHAQMIWSCIDAMLVDELDTDPDPEAEAEAEDAP